jgi:hypothetical protein
MTVNYQPTISVGTTNTQENVNPQIQMQTYRQMYLLQMNEMTPQMNPYLMNYLNSNPFAINNGVEPSFSNSTNAIYPQPPNQGF